MAYRSAQKLRRDNALSEITSDATLKAKALANLGIAAEGAQLDGTFAIENTTDTTKKIAFSASGVTTANTVTLSPPVATGSSTLVGTAATQELTAKTLTAQVVKTGLTASGSASNDFSGSTGTFKTSTGANTLSGVTTMAATKSLTLAAGTATATQAPLYLQSGTNLTAAEAGAVEYDGAVSYITNETTSGRGLLGALQYFPLTANGSTISTIANFFGATSNISLVSGGYYDIDVFLWYTNSADTNTATFTLTNSAAPTLQNIYFEMSPAAGVVAPPGTATALVGQFIGDNTAAKAFSTGALGSGASYYSRFKIWLKNSTGTSLKIQATKNTGGTLTPLAGSYWTCRRLPSAGVGSFAA